MIKPIRAIPQVARDGFWSLGVSVGNKVLALVQLIVASQSGEQSLARFSVLLGIAILSATAADFGLSPIVVRHFAAAPPHWDRNAIFTTAAIRAGFSLVLSATFALLIQTVSHQTFTPTEVALAAAYSAAYFLSTLSNAVAYGFSRFKQASLSLTILRVLAAFASLSALAAPTDLAVVTLLTIAALTEICASVLIYSRISTCFPADAPLKRPTVADSWHLGLSAFINTLVNRSDTVIIGLVSSAPTLARYSLASQVENMVTTVGIAPGAALSTHTAREPSEWVRPLKATTKVAVGLTLIAAAGAAAATPIVVPTLTGLDGVVFPILVVLLGAPASVASGLVLTSMVGRGLQGRVLTVWITLAAVSIPAMLLLTGRFGLLGAALGSVFRDYAMLTISVALARTKIKLQ